ncbi:MAG: hypothetical protein RL318_1197 [Fibrobacterota bacterium]|jgi:hypothetical protein
MQTCATRLAGLWSVQKDSLILKVARTEVSMNGTDWNGYATPYVKSHGYALSGDSLTLMVPVINLRMTYHKDGASGTK